MVQLLWILLALANFGFSQTTRQAYRDSVRASRISQTAVPSRVGTQGVDLGGATSSVAAKPLDVLPIADSIVIPTLSIRDTEIRDLLQGLAVQYNLNLFLAPEVKGPISVQFSKIKLKDALNLIIQQNGYEYEVQQGVISVRKKAVPVQEIAVVSHRFVVEWKENRLSLDLEKAPLDKVVRALVESTGKNIVIDNGVQRDITVIVQKLEFGQSLQMLARANGLLARERDGVYTLMQEAVSGSERGNRLSANAWVKVDPADGLVSVEATDAPLSQIVSELISQSGASSMIYGKIEGSVTAKLDRIPLQDALRHLFRGTAYSCWKKDGVWSIGGHEMQTAENSSLIRLKHMRAEDALKLLPPPLVKNMQVQTVRSQNALMVMGSWETIDAISQYIDKMDLPIPQILIEALVLDVDMEKARSYGLDLFIGKGGASSKKEALYPAIDQTLNRKQSQGILDKIGIGEVVRLPSNFGAQIKAMEEEKMLNVKARSQIATLNGETAVLTIGQTQYFLLKSETDYNQGSAVTNKTTERFEKVEANATLTVTPYVTGDKEVTCEIVPDFSEPEGSFSSGAPPTLNKRYVKSSVRLRNGETIVLGGMVKETNNEVHRQVPFLGSIPIIGWLFKNVETVKSRSQLLIYVTPTIYYGSEGKVDVEKVTKSLDSIK